MRRQEYEQCIQFKSSRNHEERQNKLRKIRHEGEIIRRSHGTEAGTDIAKTCDYGGKTCGQIRISEGYQECTDKKKQYVQEHVAGNQRNRIRGKGFAAHLRSSDGVRMKPGLKTPGNQLENHDDSYHLDSACCG